MAESTDLPLIQRAREHGARTAVAAAEGEFTYRELLDASARIAAWLLAGEDDLQEKRVAFLAPPSFDYVATQWAIWRAGGVAVPLATSYPPAELEHMLDDSAPAVAVAHPDLAATLRPLAESRGIRCGTTSQGLDGSPQDLPVLSEQRRALMIYTSGTTGKPKGVVTTHANLRAQITALVRAWGWTERDRILLALPLHHVHGIVNVLTCALWSGARCDMMPKFDAEEVWSRFIDQPFTLFMAVPTVYGKLITAWESAPSDRQRVMSQSCDKIRLMVSGSAALPIEVLERWRGISGHVLLERYGMTELGMALSNPLEGERVPGHVGTALPGVEIRLVDDDGGEVEPGTPGEIRVKGPNVFLEYWNRPEETSQAFHDGWFATGDTAVLEDGSYRILGRNNIDIIKTGGYKVSALEIEAVLRMHPDVEECAVVGVDDPEWGERVCVALELRAGCDDSLDELRAFAAARLAPYKVPRDYHAVDGLPRNAMGKVTKPDISALFTKRP